MNKQQKPSPYRWRTAARRRLPWFLIDLGVANKGEDCEKAGAVMPGITGMVPAVAATTAKSFKPARCGKKSRIVRSAFDP